MPDFDTSVPHIARVYDYWLGGKDNISQVVSTVPYSDHTQAIQAGQACYSKAAAFAVRTLSGSSLSAYVRFIDREFLTLT
ncbi:MAG: SAM-dependent methyltransferase [Streptosporangiaceae bacterium]